MAKKETRKPLKALEVRNAAPGVHYDGGRMGLQLHVSDAGSKRWIQRIAIGGKRADLGLGSLADVSLAQAREKAAANRALIRAGGDPRAAKKPVEVMTFDLAAKTLLTVKVQGLSNAKAAAQWGSTLTAYASPTIGRKAVAEITVADVQAILEPLWFSKPETASRVRGRIESVLSWATVHGHREGPNPAAWKNNLDAILPRRGKAATTDHHPAVALDEVAAWWKALTGADGMGAVALRFAVLTAARSGEVRGAVWSEIDLEKRLWCIPAERMKMRKPHRVPLSDAAVKLLKALPSREGLLFSAIRGGQLSDMTISACMRRLHQAELEADRPGWLDPSSKRAAVPHGVARSSFRDWVSERTDFSGELAEQALAHRISNATEAAYRRGDQLEKRREMMQAWAKFLGA